MFDLVLKIVLGLVFVLSLATLAMAVLSFPAAILWFTFLCIKESLHKPLLKKKEQLCKDREQRRLQRAWAAAENKYWLHRTTSPPPKEFYEL